MPSESHKTRAVWNDVVRNFFNGSCIDIGCGNSPVFPHVEKFDREQGDANHIEKYISKKYDCVFSSHTLEHMYDPFVAIGGWYSLVKPGGYLIVIVPDEDLYEQGAFPSKFNHDHKATFTIAKTNSWSEKSVNVYDLAKSLGGVLISLELQDHNYNRKLMTHSTANWRFVFGKIHRKLHRLMPGGFTESIVAWLFSICGAVLDQTYFGDSRLAQIQLVIRKPE